MDLYLSLSLFVFLVFLDEKSIANTPIFQLFIQFISSYIPAIQTISGASEFPQMSGLLFSICWGIMPITLLIFIFRIGNLETYFVEKSINKKFIIDYLFLVVLFFGIYLFYEGDILNSNIGGNLLKTQVGCMILAWMMSFVVPQFVATWFLMNIRIFQIINKKADNNEN